MQVSDSSLGTPLLMHPSYSQGRVWRKINPPYLHPPFIDWIHGLVRAPGPTNERGSYDLSRWLFQLGDQLSITTSSPSPRWEMIHGSFFVKASYSTAMDWLIDCSMTASSFLPREMFMPPWSGFSNLHSALSRNRTWALPAGSHVL